MCIFVLKGEAFGTRNKFNLNFTKKTLTAGTPLTFCFLFLMEEELFLTSNGAEYDCGVT